MFNVIKSANNYNNFFVFLAYIITFLIIIILFLWILIDYKKQKNILKKLKNKNYQKILFKKNKS